MNDPMSITIDDSQFQKLIKKYPGEVKKAVKDSLFAGILLVQNIAKELSPYKTGNLRRSDNEVGDYEASVGTDVIYARVQEFGYSPRNIPPYNNKGYLRPALAEREKEIIEIFSQNLNKIKI